MKQAIPLAVLMVAFLTATNIIAQQLPRARITSIFPAGGQQGTTMDATISGGDLEEAKQLIFSHPGIKAVPKKDDNGKVVVNQYAITIAKNVPVGIYDVQVGGGRFGVSNVRAFVVGDFPEAKATAGTSADKAMEINVGTTINGQAVARNYSFFKFTLKKGQRILVECQAPAIDSKMAPVLVAVAVEKAVSLEVAVKVDKEEAPLLQYTYIKMEQMDIFMTVSFLQETLALEALGEMVVPVVMAELVVMEVVSKTVI